MRVSGVGGRQQFFSLLVEITDEADVRHRLGTTPYTRAHTLAILHPTPISGQGPGWTALTMHI